MPRYIALTFLAAVLTGCLSTPDSAPTPSRSASKEGAAGLPVVWWSTSELGITRLSGIDAELAKPFEGNLVVTDKAKEKGLIVDCASARNLQTQGYKAQYPRDIAVLGVLTAKCLALEALKTAQPARINYMPVSPYDGRVIDMLPAALAPAVSPTQQAAIELAGRGGQPIRMVESTVAFVAARGDDEILLGGEGWQETLVLLGRGDFDSDSKLDWLVRTDLAVQRGTHRVSRLFLITRDSPEMVMRVIRELKSE